MWRYRAQQRSTPVKREATIAGLASEGLALILGSAGTVSSAVVGPRPTDPVEFRKCARDLKTLSAVRKYTNEERGGSRDPGVRRPGAGRGQLPAQDLCCRRHLVFDLLWTFVSLFSISLLNCDKIFQFIVCANHVYHKRAPSEKRSGRKGCRSTEGLRPSMSSVTSCPVIPPSVQPTCWCPKA